MATSLITTTLVTKSKKEIGCTILNCDGLEMKDYEPK